MKRKIQKTAQAAPTPSNQPVPQVKESAFTKSDFATSIHQFLQGINEFASLGMVSKGVSSILSNIIGIGNQFLVANIGANYLQRELILGISKYKKENEIVPSKDTILSSFSNSVANRIRSAFQKFENFINYSEELVGSQNISADPKIVDECDDLKQKILRLNKNESKELKKELFNLINKVSERLEIIKNTIGVEFSLINQFLNLDSAVKINLNVDINTFSKEKYDLNNLSPDLISKLLSVLKELKNLQILIETINNISSEYKISSISVSKKQKPTPTPTPTPSSGISIDKVFNANSLIPYGNNTYKLPGIKGFNPNISLELSGTISKNSTAFDVFNNLVATNNIIINDGSNMANPPPQLAIIDNELNDPNSGLLSLSKNKNKYILTISIPSAVVNQLIGQPFVTIITFVIGGQNYFLKSANNKYIFNSYFSEISFNINDLIDDSSNISKRDKQKIINKLKK